MQENIPGFSAEEAIVALKQSWEIHSQAFGPILEPAFSEDIPTRITLIAALNLISRREILHGLEKLQSVKEKCSTHEDWAAWWFFVGLCFEMNGVREQMLTCYENAGKYGHRFYLPYLKMAKAAHVDGALEKAEKHYLKAIACLQDADEAMILASAYANYGSCLIAAGRLRDAEAALISSEKVMPRLTGREEIQAALLELMRKNHMTSLLMNQNLELLRKYLFAAGFSEAQKQANHFYKRDTELTAFFVNITEHQGTVCMYYGLASTAFTRMKGDEKTLIERGINEQEACLRFYLEISDEMGRKQAEHAVEKTVEKYAGMQKQELLSLIKTRRADFMTQINAVLKPLGFRKKGNLWKYQLDDNAMLEFWADKGSYSDEYIFEISVYCNTTARSLRCFYVNLTDVWTDKHGHHGRKGSGARFDWQTESAEELTALMEYAVKAYLLPIINAPLSDPTQREALAKHFKCPGSGCDSCWFYGRL